MRSMYPVSMLGLALLAAAAPLRADVFTVGSGGSHATVQAAIDAAVLVAGDHEIRVQSGTYPENLALPGLGSATSLAVTGGWNSGFTSRSSDPSLTVIDGGMLDRVLNVTASSGTVSIDGLTFSNGTRGDQGAGISIDPGSGATLQMTLSNCRVRASVLSNPANSVFGGGIYAPMRGTSRLEIDGCEIDDNTVVAATTNLAGGGVYLLASVSAEVVLRNSHVHGNTVDGASSTPGAGVWVRSFGTASVEIVANRIEGNSATSGTAVDGAGLVVDAFGTSTAGVHSNVVLDNIASTSQGASQVTLDVDEGASIRMTDSIVAGGNSTGVAAYVRGDVQLTNLTLADHGDVGLDVNLSGAGTASVYNTIAYGNVIDADIAVAVDTGNNLVGVDPLFADPAADDYRLLPASKAINSGDGAPPGGLGTWDAGGPGSPRVLDDRVDVGAYEDGGPTIFANGFESGLAFWSTVVP